MKNTKLSIILKNIKQDRDYQCLKKWEDRNLFESYVLLGELLDPNNSYSYKEEGKGIYTYTDILKNKFFVRLAYQPTSIPYLELKTGWFDRSKIRYDMPADSTTQDWDKRSNTVAKIYKDEIAKFFKNQTLTDTLVIKPLDIKRYQFSIRLVNKFKFPNTEIIEDKPKKITIQKTS